MWDLIVSVPDHCLSFYFANKEILWVIVVFTSISEIACINIMTSLREFERC